MRSAALALAFFAAAGLPAGAATLSTANGDVMVNTGQGFKKGTAGETLKPGDRVMVGRNGGDATVTYDLSCFERVTVGTVVTVQAGVPCQAPGAQTTVSPLGNVPVTGLIIGGAAAVGAGVLIYQAQKSSSP